MRRTGFRNAARKLSAGFLALALLAGAPGAASALADAAVPATGVTLDMANVAVAAGGTATLTATVAPQDATDKAVAWSTSDAGVATAEGGVVTGVAPGTAVVTVTTHDGGFTAQCTVTVTPQASGLSLDRQALDLCPGDTFQLNAAVVPAEAAAGVTWSTSDAGVAEVSGGAVTAKAVGTADIAAATADGAYRAVCRVTVKPSGLASAVYTADRGNGLLIGVSKFTPPGVLITNLSNAPADVGVLDRDGNAYAGVAVGTGMTVTLTVNGTLRDSLKIVVSGDTNGDGAISITDYTLARLDILGLKKLSGEYMRAGDVNGDGAVTITDYTLMRLDILGIKPIGGAGVNLPEVSDPRIKSFLEFALTLRGKPYVWGDEGPDTFDCSGFVYYCLNQTGYKVGRTTADSYSKYAQWQYVAKDSLQPGDLLFFISDDNPKVIGHVGIYMGNGNLINASYSYGCIIVCPLAGWYVDHLSHARRVFY